jgi:hypothetical protein
MPALIGPIGSVVNMNQAVNGNAAGNPVYVSQLNVAESAALGGVAGLIASYNSQLASSASATLATSVMNNLFITAAAGVPAANVTALTTALTQAFDAYPTAKGQVISNLSTILGNLESDATWGPAARLFNNQAASNYSYSINPANTGSGTPTNSASFTMTTNVDTITGNTNISAVTVGAGAPSTGTTLNVFDTVNVSGSGIQSLTVSMAGTAATLDATNTPLLSGIDLIALTSLTGATSIAMGVAPDIATLNLGRYAAASAVTVTAAPAALMAYNITGGSQAVNDLTVTYAANALNATNDTIALSLNAVNASGFTVADDALYTFQGAANSASGVETFNIAATGSNALESLISLRCAGGATALNAVTVTGTGSLSVDTALAFNATTNVGTINASANTGGVTFTVGAQDITFTGGTGNDTLIFNAAGALNANDTITMGGGTADTVIVADTAVNSTTTALNTAITNTGAEVVGFSAAGTYALGSVTATNILLGYNVDQTVTQIAATDTIIVKGAGADRDMTLTASLGFNTLNLNFVAENTVASTSCTVGATGQSTINIVSTSDSSSLTNLTGVLTVSDNTVINVSGNGNLSIGDAAAGDAIVGSVALNASALTGRLTVIASNTASSIVGGSGNDTITGGTGNDTITGGAGIDTIGTGAPAAGAGADTVTGGLGADLITAVAVTGSAGANTIAYNATAAESYASSTATGLTNADTLTVTTATSVGGNTVVTFTTGVLSNQTGALTTTGTLPVIGTTAVTANGFVVYAESATSYYAYQDTDGNGIINSGDWMVAIVGSNDTETFAVTAGKLVFTNTGV